VTPQAFTPKLLTACALAAAGLLLATTGAGAAGGQSASPFAAAWANVPRSQAAREAKSIVVFGQEQDIAGFNTALACCSQFWAGVQTVPVIRGAFLITNTLELVKDLVVRARATPTTLTYTIRKNASWNWGGRRLPVTWEDFVYTWQQMVAPQNQVVSRSGYDQITGYTHSGLRTVTFQWSKPFADWRDLFSTVYPAQALAGLDFNRVWTSCICGNDGKPVSDGPFSLTSYTAGQGSTLEANPFWYGRKPGLKQVVFKVITDTNSEVRAMRAGEVDAINPTFGVNLLPLRAAPGITYNQVPGLFQEHIDIQFGAQGNQLLRVPWMRRAIMMAIDRATIIRTVYGDLAGSTKPLNSLVYYQSDAAYKPDFARWSYSPKKALKLLKAHCEGGPRVPSTGNTTYWSCSGIPARFRYTWTVSNSARTTQAAIVKDDLRRVGIEIVDAPLPASVIFGPSGIPSSNYDLADFAWVTSPDPAGFVPIWGCGGQANYMQYCNRRATQLLELSDNELDPKKRASYFQRADKLFAADVPSIPLYSRPNPLVWKTGIRGMRNNPSLTGFAWNIEQWRWRRK
jgi:peptide/nickel transport system substrate-binding protein